MTAALNEVAFTAEAFTDFCLWVVQKEVERRCYLYLCLWNSNVSVWNKSTNKHKHFLNPPFGFGFYVVKFGKKHFPSVFKLRKFKSTETTLPFKERRGTRYMVGLVLSLGLLSFLSLCGIEGGHVLGGGDQVQQADAGLQQADGPAESLQPVEPGCSRAQTQVTTQKQFATARPFIMGLCLVYLLLIWMWLDYLIWSRAQTMTRGSLHFNY